MKKLLTAGYYMLVAGILCIAMFLGATLIPGVGNYDFKIVLSGSMEPEILTGSLVFIVPSDTYYVSDIVTFGGSGKTDIPTTHRIVKVRVQSGVKMFTTQGDANAYEDTKEVQEKNILGKVVLSIPYVGYVLDFVKQPLGFLLVIIVPAILIGLFEVVKIYKESRALYLEKRKRKKGFYKRRYLVDQSGKVVSTKD